MTVSRIHIAASLAFVLAGGLSLQMSPARAQGVHPAPNASLGVAARARMISCLSRCQGAPAACATRCQ